MNKTLLCLGLVIVTAVAGAGFASPACADPLYYEGYFQGQMNPAPPQGYIYRAAPNTIQPSFYYQYRVRPLPQPNGDCTPPPAWNNPGGSGQSLTMLAPRMLPGIYWYQDPNLFRQPPMCNLGYPYITPRY